MTESDSVSVVPAQLAFLAIYNPSLGKTDETIGDQIVFYSSPATRSRPSAGTSVNDPASGEHRDDLNRKLRQVGLAQGMVNFAKNFSAGKSVNSIETEKSRIVLDELENDWWILASIDLTRLPSHGGANTTSEAPSSRIEYSSRELYPPQSIIQQLRRAHSIFLLHHDISLNHLYERVGRQTFCKLLNRFWNKFIRNWLVLLNGNPAVDIFNGIKLALGGELGIGVGEEAWGSGEREVLEDFVTRTNGLVDLVVSRFGDLSEKSDKSSRSESETQRWLGSDHNPQPSDGVIFSGVGSISRRSLARISHWMEWIYRYGGAAYGVDENPASVRRGRQRKTKRRPDTGASPQSGLPEKKSKSKSQVQSRRTSPGIPPPLVVAAPPATSTQPQTESHETEDSMFGTEALMKYLTLGYGSAWKFPNLSASDSAETTDANSHEKAGAGQSTSGDIQSDETLGKFIIGLKDDLEEEVSDDDSAEGAASGTTHGQGEASNSRTLLRTLQVETVEPGPSSRDEKETPSKTCHKKLQVIVYVRRPFMFVFLFDLRTPSLSLPSFYRSIHHQLGPLQRPLLSSTSPQNIHRRIQLSNTEPSNNKKLAENPIYDLIYDPSKLTVRSSIPNIPEPGIVSGVSTTYKSPYSTAGSNGHDKWSRVEALNVHSHFLSTYTDTRSRPLETERTCKTSRGWWLLWVRVDEGRFQQETPPSPTISSQTEQHEQEQEHTHIHIDTDTPSKEVFLIRKASDSSSSSSSSSAAGARQARSGGSSGVRFLRDLSGASSSLTASDSAGHMTTPGKLAEGLGLDAHKYIESLLSLNR